MRLTTTPRVRQHLDPEDELEIRQAEPGIASAAILAVEPPSLTRPGRYRCTISADGLASAAWASTPIGAFRAAHRAWRESAA